MASSISRWVWALGTILLGAAAAAAPGCGDDGAKGGAGGSGGSGGAPATRVTPAAYGSPWDTLAEWNLFADVTTQTPAERVVPFEVISPLFSDYTHKWRFIYLPEGTTITYSDTGAWEFPVGSILVKTFAYLDDPSNPAGGKRLLETRLLWREPSGWTPHTYVYSEDQTTAVREIAGKFIPYTFTKPGGETIQTTYKVPNTNECKDCHSNDDAVQELGPKTRQLDKAHDYGEGPVNQIDHLFSIGYLDKAPAPAGSRVRLVDPFADAAATTSLKARSYFDANCAHCHTTGGFASQSGLLLDYDATDPSMPPANWGICKAPTSASGATCGNSYDVVPGDPDASIMACRFETTEIEDRMPPLGSAVVHAEGLALVRQWIAEMPADDCNPMTP